MDKHLLFAIVPATILLPAIAARARSARAGLRRALLWMLAFEALYLLLLARGYRLS